MSVSATYCTISLNLYHRNVEIVYFSTMFVSFRVIAVETQRLKLRTSVKMIGHVHKSELSDQPDSKKALLPSYHVGQILSARVIGQTDVSMAKKSAKGRRVLTKKTVAKPPLYYFSIKHSVLTAPDVTSLQKLLQLNKPLDRHVKKQHKPVEIKLEDDAELGGFKQPSDPEENAGKKRPQSSRTTHPVCWKINWMTCNDHFERI